MRTVATRARIHTQIKGNYCTHAYATFFFFFLAKAVVRTKGNKTHKSSFLRTRRTVRVNCGACVKNRREGTGRRDDSTGRCQRCVVTFDLRENEEPAARTSTDVYDRWYHCIRECTASVARIRTRQILSFYKLHLNLCLACCNKNRRNFNIWLCGGGRERRNIFYYRGNSYSQHFLTRYLKMFKKKKKNELFFIP